MIGWDLQELKLLSVTRVPATEAAGCQFHLMVSCMVITWQLGSIERASCRRLKLQITIMLGAWCFLS
jgi:hypothetical protein